MPRKKRYFAKKRPVEVEDEPGALSSDDSSVDDMEEKNEMIFKDVVSEDEKEEVLPVVDSEDENDEEMDEEEENTEAWGKRKSTYYNTDFIDEDRGRSYREEDKEAAQLEEEDALDIQRRFLENIHSGAFDMGPFATDDTTHEAENNVVPTDWTTVKDKEKIEVVTQASPEFVPIMKEFKEKLIELKEDLQHVGKKTTFSDLKSQLLLHYSINASFYMWLKSQNLPVAHHPVVKRIKSFMNLLNKLKELAAKQSVVSKQKTMLSSQIKTASCLGKRKERSDDVTHGPEETNETEEAAETTEPEKRTVTYQIAKNKGLLPHRKKEYRNPRVRHRMKFKKAMIKRKGQVRTPRTETERYGGEYSGIQPNVTKSVKFK